MQFIAPHRLVDGVDLDRHLHRDHLRDLRASGLDDETITAAGVYSLPPRDLAHFFSRIPAGIQTALCFPYQDGEFARIKLFPALGKMKYAQPAETSARLYVPFQTRAGALLICEGEKKMLSAHQAGFNAVGIGGVWNWLSNGAPIADLTRIDWTKCEVRIVPDSDVFQRPDLLRAIYALGRELQALGAATIVARISQTCTKVGLDDFLCGGGDVDDLEVFSLGHRIFKNCQSWHSRWKFQKAMRCEG